MKVGSKSSNWRDWTTFGLRWMFLAGAAFAVFVLFGNALPPQDLLNQHLAIPLAVGAIANLVYGVCIYFSFLHRALPYVLIAGDMAIVGSFVYAAQGNPLILVCIAGGLIVIGLLRLGAVWGATQAALVLVVAIGVAIAMIGVDQVREAAPDYGIPLLILILPAIGAGTWVYMQEEHGRREKAEMFREAEERMLDVVDMEKRARAIFDMANTLSSTLSFEKVMEAALNIGQSLRRKPRQRITSIVMLFESATGSLYVATSRGLKPMDEKRTILGHQGLVAKALSEAVPVIGSDPTSDPELKTFSSLAGARSVICIPLRAQFNNFGILIYATDLPNAFNSENIETMRAIGTQTTVALHNAQLYTDLMDEKDRIIQLEEDGRKELARDLHDSPAQTIAAVKMRIEIIQRWLERDPSRVPQELEEVKDMADLANRQIRHVLSSLYPLALETQGLIGALNQTAKEVKDKYNQEVAIYLPAEVETYFNKQQQGVIYSLITEAVQNAAKHAEARRINVTAGQEGDNMIIQISDDGKGFDVEEARKNERGRFGLENLHRRAESLNGILTIDSQVGYGTRITMVLPVRENMRNANDRPAPPTPRLARRV